MICITKKCVCKKERSEEHHNVFWKKVTFKSWIILLAYQMFWGTILIGHSFSVYVCGTWCLQLCWLTFFKTTVYLYGKVGYMKDKRIKNFRFIGPKTRLRNQRFKNVFPSNSTCLSFDCRVGYLAFRNLPKT